MPSTSTPLVFEVDDLRTWPHPVRDLVERWHREVPQAEFPADLAIPESSPSELASLLGPDQIIRAAHFTRFLPHEIDDVRRNGLRAFSIDLFNGRLDRAHQLGYLSAPQVQRLRSGQIGVAEPDRAEGRWNTVHLTVGRAVLNEPRAVERLLTRWGGEGLFFSGVGEDEAEVLRALGAPVVVICHLTMRDIASWRFVPALPKALLAIRRGTPTYADLELSRSVGVGEVVELHGPGTAFYSAYPSLPRA